MNTGSTAKPNGRRGRSRSTQPATAPHETIDTASVDMTLENGTDLTISITASAVEPESTEPESTPAADASSDTYTPTPLPDLRTTTNMDITQLSPDQPVREDHHLYNHPVAQHEPLPGHRPITPSKQHYLYSRSLPNRPILASPTPIRKSDTLPGQRPILSGGLQVYQPSNLPGNRPIVPTNRSEETENMIGYLD